MDNTAIEKGPFLLCNFIYDTSSFFEMKMHRYKLNFLAGIVD